VAQADYFLKIEGIDGESVDEKHKGEIEILSFSWGVSQTSTQGAGSGGGSGKASFQDFHFVTHVGKASPKLFLACAQGEHFKKATLTVRKAGDRPLEYLKLNLEDVLISSYQTGGSDGGDDVPVDQMSLNFSKITYSVTSQSPDGSTAGAVTAGWDLALNKKP
jgi:type VI secretion system secreted protein Hcp